MLFEVIEKNKRKSVIAIAVMAGWYVFFYGAVIACFLTWFIAGPYAAQSEQASFTRLVIIYYFLGIITALGIFIGMFFRSRNIPLKIQEYSIYKIDEYKYSVLKNIVNEVSISAGLNKTPDIYILNSNILNAYTSGYNIEKSSIVITKGLAELLSRDELQAVIAHEISHIVNRDTIYLICSGLLYNSSSKIAERFKIKNWRIKYRQEPSISDWILRLAILIIFWPLTIIGFMMYLGMAVMLGIPGLLCRMGNCICSILLKFISKEREYLADACAVLYTRNPEALASAMRKIEKASRNNIYQKEAEQANPLIKASFFAPVKGDNTHPDTYSRIKILEEMKSADFREYERIYEKLNNKKLLPKSALENAERIEITAAKDPSPQPSPAGGEGAYTACSLSSVIADKEEIRTIKENKALLKENIKKHREVENMVQDLAGYAVINCSCGTKLKIPPVYKNQIIICPHCGKKYTL